MLLLHSGTQVLNATALALRIGWRHPLALEPSVLQVLGPRDTIWLPLLRAEHGLFCIQPAGVPLGSPPPPRSYKLLISEAFGESLVCPSHTC
jgi:hypothetical protein